jgi:hypothetical protein
MKPKEDAKKGYNTMKITRYETYPYQKKWTNLEIIKNVRVTVILS